MKQRYLNRSWIDERSLHELCRSWIKKRSLTETGMKKEFLPEYKLKRSYKSLLI